MYNAELIQLLRGDSELLSYVSTYTPPKGGTPIPSIFINSAPEGVPFQYIVVTIKDNPVDGVIVDFSVMFNIFGFDWSNVKSVNTVNRIMNLIKYRVINTTRYGPVRHFEPKQYFIDEPDLQAKHYVVMVEARATEKQWCEQLT